MVPWSKGYDTALSRLRCAVRIRRESSEAPWSNRRRTPASQAGDVGFKSRRSCCGCRTTVVRQIVVLHMRVQSPLRSGRRKTGLRSASVGRKDECHWRSRPSTGRRAPLQSPLLPGIEDCEGLGSLIRISFLPCSRRLISQPESPADHHLCSRLPGLFEIWNRAG